METDDPARAAAAISSYYLAPDIQHRHRRYTMNDLEIAGEIGGESRASQFARRAGVHVPPFSLLFYFAIAEICRMCWVPEGGALSTSGGINGRPSGVGVLTSRSRHQMRTADKSGAARHVDGAAGARRSSLSLSPPCPSFPPSDLESDSVFVELG